MSDTFPNTSPAGIRSVSQTVQEREIVKTCPDIVVYFEGLPYLINRYLHDPKTNLAFTLVNFNDHVAAFNASYDTDQLVPSASISLQVPNYLRYLYQMPGGNNLIATMMQVQVYCKGYFMSSAGDTVYRRVFKGVTSHIGYNDNGKTLEISVQCYGSMYMLELMQINLNPAVQSAVANASALTFHETIFGDDNPYRIIADIFTRGLQSDGFQLDSFYQNTPNADHARFADSINRGYIAKWQAILTNMAKDVHVYGSSYKDNPRATADAQEKATSKGSSVKGQMDKDTQAAALTRYAPVGEAEDVADNTYYSKICAYHPHWNIKAVDLTNSNIVNRLTLLQEIIKIIGFEGYQDLDGKVIVKPPLYNLDVLYLGPRTSQLGTSTTARSKANSQTNPLTEIYPENNPFVVQLAEILTEQESEDQAAIRMTRRVVTGGLTPQMGNQVDLQTAVKQVGEYVDIGKLAKFGLREEPAKLVPWLNPSDREALFATAIVDTVRANRGYRTYTCTIPLRPELKLGFPVFFPHKDMYGYVKSISINYSVGQSATMTVTCDSLRRRVLVNTTYQTNDNPPREISAYVTAPNLVYVWAYNPNPETVPDVNQSPNTSVKLAGQMESQVRGGPNPQVNREDWTDLRGTAVSLYNLDDDTQPSPQQLLVRSYYSQTLASSVASQFDTAFAHWVVQNDGDQVAKTVSPRTGKAYFTDKRIADYYYLQDIRGNKDRTAVIPFTDYKGYEVLAPFPWGRYTDLNSAVHEFTEMGWVTGVTGADGNPANLQDLAVLQATDAFIFAGLGTPTATGDAVTKLETALQSQQALIGGLQTAHKPGSSNTYTLDTSQAELTMDATVVVLKYDANSQNDSSLLNTAQPEDALVAALIKGTQTTMQQVVDVLVSGGVAPTVGTQEALFSTKISTTANTLGSVAQEFRGLFGVG